MLFHTHTHHIVFLTTRGAKEATYQPPLDCGRSIFGADEVNGVTFDSYPMSSRPVVHDGLNVRAYLAEFNWLMRTVRRASDEMSEMRTVI